MRDELTLKLLSEKVGGSELEMKRKLIRWKNQGELFIPSQIAALSLEDPFELYFSLAPPLNQAHRNAFPVRLSLFQNYKYRSEQINFIKSHYHRYFDYDNVAHPDKFYLGFSNVYKGREWMWFYRKINFVQEYYHTFREG